MDSRGVKTYAPTGPRPFPPTYQLDPTTGSFTGTAQSGISVNVTNSVDKRTHSIVADADGNWALDLGHAPRWYSVFSLWAEDLVGQTCSEKIEFVVGDIYGFTMVYGSGTVWRQANPNYNVTVSRYRYGGLIGDPTTVYADAAGYRKLTSGFRFDERDLIQAYDTSPDDKSSTQATYTAAMYAQPQESSTPRTAMDSGRHFPPILQGEISSYGVSGRADHEGEVMLADDDLLNLVCAPSNYRQLFLHRRRF